MFENGSTEKDEHAQHITELERLVGRLKLTTLRRALATCIPEIHHSDQGVQYAAYAYTNLRKKKLIYLSILISRIPKRRPPVLLKMHT